MLMCISDTLAVMPKYCFSHTILCVAGVVGKGSPGSPRNHLCSNYFTKSAYECSSKITVCNIDS